MSLLKSSSINQMSKEFRAFLGSLGLFLVLGVIFLGLKSWVSAKSTDLKNKEYLVREVAAFEARSKTSGVSKRDFYGKTSPSDFVGEMLELVNRSRLKLLSVKPEEKEKLRVGETDFLCSPITFKVRGEFELIYNFLHLLEEYPHFLIEDGLVIEKVDEGSVEMQVRILLPESGSESAK